MPALPAPEVETGAVDRPLPDAVSGLREDRSAYPDTSAAAARRGTA